MLSYHINGDEPQLVGARCTRLVLQHFYEGRQIIDEVNVAHLRLDEQWYRLYFECGTIFWCSSDNPEIPENSSLLSGLLLNDLSGLDGVVGHTIRDVTYEASQSGDVLVTLRFSSGNQLTFKYSCEADATQFVSAASSDLDRA